MLVFWSLHLVFDSKRSLVVFDAESERNGHCYRITILGARASVWTRGSDIRPVFQFFP